MTFYIRLMHQSIPAVPIPPQATAGHLLTLSVPGVGHSQFYHSPGGWTLAYPGATPGHLTHMFSKDRNVHQEGQGLCQRLACPSGIRKTMFLKEHFSILDISSLLVSIQI